MMRIISIIVALVLTLGCARASQTSTNAPVQLKPEMFIGYEFTLISKDDYVVYLFLDSERVNVSGGVVMGSDYDWKIKDGHTLSFTEPRASGTGPERISLQFKSIGKNIAVTTDGSKFRRKKYKLPD